MSVNMGKRRYAAGIYTKQRPDAAILAALYVDDYEKERLKMKGNLPEKIAPSICFSRKIGVGALEIADMLAGKINVPVVDREILDHMAKDAKLSKRAIEIFDERYPGKMTELAAMLFGEKSFIMSDYIRNFVSTVFAFADRGSTIFVGRGTHLVLPRDRVLAVRFISSNEFRIKRLAKVLDVKEKEADKLLVRTDKEQRDFFKKVFEKNDASPYEFDLVINCDYITEPQGAVEIVKLAFREKFSYGAKEK